VLHQEFLKFLKKIDKNLLSGLDVHLVCDNYGTHKTRSSRTGSPVTPASTSTSPRPDHRGSTRSSAGPATSPTRRSAAASTSPSRH
jgi:hypothetical protein